MERGILAGLAVYRWAAWAWMAAVVLLTRRTLVHASVAYALVGAALAVTALVTVLLRTDPRSLRRPGPVAAETTIGALLIAADGWVHASGHAFSSGQSIGVAWPLAGVLASGVAGGPWAGAAAGLGMGAARVVAVLVNGVTVFGDEEVLSLASTAFLYAIAGTVAGHATRLLRRAEREVSRARAREEVARTLHDGVLQTLAVIERRADDPALARMAREQERELRSFVAGLSERQPGLAAALRDAAGRFEDSFGGRCSVVVAPDIDEPSPDVTDAVAGAVGEALTNAGKHGAARNVTVFVEPSGDGLFCSVKDDGSGFDPSTVPDGMGLDGSIRGRITDLGGRVEVESRPGGPTEVRLWTR